MLMMPLFPYCLYFHEEGFTKLYNMHTSLLVPLPLVEETNKICEMVEDF